MTPTWLVTLAAIGMTASAASPLRPEDMEVQLRHENGRPDIVRLRRTGTVQGLELEAGTTAQLFDDGHLRSGTLSVDQLVDGIPAMAHTEVTFYRNGRLGTLRLSREHTVQGQRLPAGAWLLFSDLDGHLVRAHLVQSALIDGVPCQGGGPDRVEFHANGRLWYATLG